MGTLSQIKKRVMDRARELAIYNSLPDDLASDLKAANAKLTLTETTFEFTDCPQVLIDRVHKFIEEKKSN